MSPRKAFLSIMAGDFKDAVANGWKITHYRDDAGVSKSFDIFEINHLESDRLDRIRIWSISSDGLAVTGQIIRNTLTVGTHSFHSEECIEWEQFVSEAQALSR